MTDDRTEGDGRSETMELVDAIVAQGAVQIDKGHNAFTVAAALSFRSVDLFEDHRADWDVKYDLAPHIRTMVYRELCECEWTTLHRFLEAEDRAQTLGYDTERFADSTDAPSRTALSRAWNNYMSDEVTEAIEKACQRLREIARETGNLIGSQTLETEDKQDGSARTKHRVKRRKSHEVAEQFRDVFYDELSLDMPDGATYTKEDLFDLFLHIGFTDDFANNGSLTWKEEVDDEETAPSGDTLRRYIRLFDEFEEGEVSEMFDAVSDVLWGMAKRRGYCDGYVDLAIDGNAWRFYGDVETPRVSTVDPDRGTNRAYEFLTLSIIGDEGEKFTVAVQQVASEQEKLEAVKEMVGIGNERLFVREVVLDRGFYGVLFAQALLETGVNFVIRAIRGAKSNEMWEEAEDGVNIERATMSRSRAPYESVTITRFVVPARESMDVEYVSFITNRELTQRQARRIGETYERRWGIETSYRVMGNFLPKTASTDVALRVFYYRMSVLLYNMWVLVNAVVSESIGHPSDASPPVTAKYLLIILRNKHDEQGTT